VGDFHSCAILLDGTVSCWGSNSEGQVGHGEVGTTQPPAPVPNIVFAEAGDAGLDQTCVLLQNRTLRCWGRYAAIDFLQQVDQVQVGRRFSCAVVAGRVHCWGANDHGQLGDGTFVDRASASPVLEIDDARSLALGSSHGCVVAGAGELWCWGDNQAAQLNDGNWPHDRGTPARVDIDPVRFGEGFRHACVSLESGRVECWGWNEWGQVGFDTAAIHLVPTRVLGLDPR
jgi:alpha-tubulin suppressor-like RCC1 family protein